jgi:hypothetical protein
VKLLESKSAGMHNSVERLLVEAGGKLGLKFEKGTVGHAQFAYKTKRSKAEREAAVTVLTGLRSVSLAVAA